MIIIITNIMCFMRVDGGRYNPLMLNMYYCRQGVGLV